MGPALVRVAAPSATTAGVRLQGVVRPAYVLRPGESIETPAPPLATQAVFAVATASFPPPECGPQHLVVALDGRTLEDLTLQAREPAWHMRDLSVPAGRQLTFRHLAAPSCPALHLSVPRLYAQPSRTPGRVLVWISQDALRADHLGAYGSARPTSPRFDAWARGAVLLEEASASAPWTLPSLASQLTGRHPAWHGAVLNKLSCDDPTVFESLSRAGFTVLGSTANGFLSERHGLFRGFDMLRLAEGERARGQLNRLLSRLEEWHGGDLALFVHVLDPHLPYDPPEGFRDRFDPDYTGPVRGRSLFHTRPNIPERDRQHLMALYDEEIAANDDAIGAFLEELRRRGLLEQAVVVYTSDHGESFQEHGSWLHGGTLFDEVLHVPLAIAAPGLAPRRVAEPVSLVDLAPTLLDLLGLPPLEGAHGRSLRPVLEGGRPAGRPIFSETILTAAHDRLVSVRSGPLKYVLRLARGSSDGLRPLEEHLFDLAADPGETRNLGPGDPQAARLRRMALAYVEAGLREARTPRTVELDPETEAKLRAWGYIQ